jgi:hypothetical protein
MSTVEQIEHAIGDLSSQERDELFAWMDEQYPQAIDAQLKADLDAGRMDDLIRKALVEHGAGRARTL